MKHSFPALLCLAVILKGTGIVQAQTSPSIPRTSTLKIISDDLETPPVPTNSKPTPQLTVAPPTPPVPETSESVAPVEIAPTVEHETLPEEETVQLNFPTEVELETLVEYVSQRLKIRILFDDTIANKKIRISSSGNIPVRSLLQVLQSALKMKELTLVDGEVVGWKRIVPVNKLGNIAQQGDARTMLEQGEIASPVIQIFTLRYADVSQIQQLIQPFLSQPGGTCTPVKEGGLLIVTDYAENVMKVDELIRSLDKPQTELKTEFIKVHYIEAVELGKQVTELLQARTKGGQLTAARLTISSDPRTNQLILVGTDAEIAAAKELMTALDVPSALTTEVYSPDHVNAKEVDTTLRGMLDPLQEKTAYRSVINRNNNSLVITTTPEIHKKVVEMIQGLNKPTEQKRSPVRFYKLNNTTVDEVLTTLRALQQMNGAENGASASRANNLYKSLPGSQSAANHIGGAVTFPLSPGEPLPQLKTEVESESTNTPPDTTSLPVAQDFPLTNVTSADDTSFLDANVRLTADTKTNTIIIIAEPQVQEYYAKLIDFLDKRSPQVLVEVKIVTIDTSNDFTLGVEISGGKRSGIQKYFAFSSFGLSTPDPVTGALALKPGVGFNGVLVDPETADVIIQALSTNSRAKVSATPQILVNDNEDGRLQSVLSIPYTSVNSSQVVQSTSLGGNQEAGTSIIVTPHIGDGDQLQLNFAIEFSSFGAGSDDNLPPPRHIDQVSSVVTIPDGYTVIVGGLNRQNYAESTQGIPFLDRIPIVKYLASVNDKSGSTMSLFVFIKPIILRDDKFKDLKFLSDRSSKSAGFRTLPCSSPMIMQ